MTNKHGDARCVRGSADALCGGSSGVSRLRLGVPAACDGSAGAVAAQAPAAGRPLGPEGVRAGGRGHRAQSSDAVSQFVPEQTRISSDVRGLYGYVSLTGNE